MKISLSSVLGSVAVSLVLCGVVIAGPDIDTTQWVDRSLLPAERTLLERSVGYAPSALDHRLTWLAGAPTAWTDLRGKVVILQSFSANEAGRTALTRLSKFMSRADPAGVAAVAVHTPENQDKAPAFVGGTALGFPIAIDSVGRFCDDMGIWKTPTIILIDRFGAVRAAGVPTSKLQAAVTALLAEKFDEATPLPKPVPPRPFAGTDPADPQKSEQKPAFPSVTPRGSAVNLIGKPGPPLAVQTWLTDQPITTNKVLIVDFWATWCGPCRATIPHMNDLAAKFKNSVVAVGLSDEDAAVIRAFMRKTTMNYPIATDPGDRMARVTQHKGIPFVIVMSPDGIVRWQGHPASLDEAILKQIVDASAPKESSPAGLEELRWVKSGVQR